MIFAPFTIRNKILLGFLFPVILVCFFSLYISDAIRSSLDTANWVRHTQEVISDAQKIEKLMINMETGHRGFLLTEDKIFLEPFITSKLVWQSEIDSLIKLVDDNPYQVNKANEIKDASLRWIDSIAEHDIYQFSNLKTSFEDLKDDVFLKRQKDGKQQMDGIRLRIAEFINEESRLMNDRQSKAKKAAELAYIVSSFGLPLLALFAAMIAVSILFSSILPPIGQLLKATNLVTQGDLNVEIENPTNDEVGQLTRSFNSMINSLRSASEDKQALNDHLIKAHSALSKKAKELEKTMEHKSQFLANMSHEIRTPINGTIGMLEIALGGELPNKPRSHCNTALDSARSLLAIVNDILDFSKIEAGKLEIDSVQFCIHDVFTSFCQSIAHRAQLKGLELVLDLIDLPHAEVVGDPGRLRQILNNLVGNAIKFTDFGDVVIRAKLNKTIRNTGILECSIVDTGVGISSTNIPHMFDEFTQEDTTTTRNYGGTGLGLSIVRRLCKLMNGDISVGSIKGVGSEFKFQIEFESVLSEKNIFEENTSDNIQVLIMNSSLKNMDIIKRQFERWEVKTFVVSNFQDIPVLRSTERNDQVFLFLDSKEMSSIGASFVDRIADFSTHKDQHFVILKDINEELDGIEFLYKNAATLNKPISADSLINLLRDENTNPSFLDSTNLSESLPNANGNRVLLVEDNAVNQQVALIQLEEMNLTVEVADNGKEAISILEKYGSDSFALIIMDCQMPEMDGYEASKLIRSGTLNIANPNIPIIAMTANAMKGDREKCLSAGMSDYLSKPVSLKDLAEKISLWLPGIAEDIKKSIDA